MVWYIVFLIEQNLKGPTMMSDASEMLAAALEQMDGIIAGMTRVLVSSVLYSMGFRSLQFPPGAVLHWQACEAFKQTGHLKGSS